MTDNVVMKTITILCLLLLLACNKADDAEKNELDLRLFEGSGQWQSAIYYPGVSMTAHRDTLTFTGDEVQYLIESSNGAWSTDSDTRVYLVPLGTKKVRTATVEAVPVLEVWSYRITGNILKVCDEVPVCVEFTKL